MGGRKERSAARRPLGGVPQPDLQFLFQESSCFPGFFMLSCRKFLERSCPFSSTWCVFLNLGRRPLPSAEQATTAERGGAGWPNYTKCWNFVSPAGRLIAKGNYTKFGFCKPARWRLIGADRAARTSPALPRQRQAPRPRHWLGLAQAA